MEFGVVILFVFVLLCLYGLGIGVDNTIHKNKIKTLNKITDHINNLPEKREDKPGSKINSPDLGKGKFDKQRVVYRDGDNT